MNNLGGLITNRIIILSSVVILIGLSYGMAFAASPSIPVPLPVMVENTSANPVPVTGSVGINGTVPISGNVGISNIPNVNITNTPNVNISGTSSPIPVSGNISLSTASTTVLASGSLSVTTNTTAVSGAGVSLCDRVRFSINVPRYQTALNCLIYDPLTQSPFSTTQTAAVSPNGSYDVMTFVLEPLATSLSVQCSAVDNADVPTSVSVNYALYCR